MNVFCPHLKERAKRKYSRNKISFINKWKSTLNTSTERNLKIIIGSNVLEKIVYLLLIAHWPMTIYAHYACSHSHSDFTILKVSACVCVLLLKYFTTEMIEWQTQIWPESNSLIQKMDLSFACHGTLTSEFSHKFSFWFREIHHVK